MSEPIILSKLKESDLIERAQKWEEQSGSRRTDALKELSRRRAQKKLSGTGQKSLQDLAEKYASNSRSAPELRKVATVVLGKISSSSQPALFKALQSDDPTLVILAAESLGQTGDSTAIETLEGIKLRSNHPAAEALEFAKSLLSYRHGHGTHLIRPTPPNGCVDIGRRTKGRVAFEPDRIERRDRVEALLESVSEELRAIIPVFKKKAWTFECGLNRNLLVFNEDFLKPRFLESLAEKNTLAAVLLDRHSCSPGCFVSEYFLVNPAKSGQGSIVGIQPQGTRVHAGKYTLDLESQQVNFSLRTVRKALARAIDFVGTFDKREARLTLEKNFIFEIALEEQ